ncbi:hypothetical protein SKAU_G00034970 [Synaphobranchus kaupii]|uniref:Uncharacterized protein n=1 Tax=Synaphobranchus kaupii TaxID=118154 RepID=A0A9Q1GG18_SYNKA|nr:hypothetical protein SKAU_G00034970 [Synaphobranchus kaupii]
MQDNLGSRRHEKAPANWRAVKRQGWDHGNGVLVVLLQVAISAQLFMALILKHGEFVRDEGLVISPYQLCVLGPEGQECSPVFHSGIACVMLVLFVYAPLALTLFAALSYLFGVCLPDGHGLRFSLVVQALAAVGMFAGTVAFLIACHWRLGRLPGLTAAFYLSACACAEMGVATLLCWLSVIRRFGWSIGSSV